MLPIPGLAGAGIGFKTIGEAIQLRNHVLAQLDAAAAARARMVRRRALTFLFVHGGYAGVEAVAELEDMARDACAATRRSTRRRCAGCWWRRSRVILRAWATPATVVITSAPATTVAAVSKPSRGWPPQGNRKSAWLAWRQ